MSLVPWPLSEHEAEVDLVLIHTSFLFLIKSLLKKLVSIRMTWIKHKAGRVVSAQGQLQKLQEKFHRSVSKKEKAV